MTKYSHGYDPRARCYYVGVVASRGTINKVTNWCDTAAEAEEVANQLNNKQQEELHERQLH